MTDKVITNLNLEWGLKYLQKSWSLIPVHGIKDGQCTCGDPACKSEGKHPACLHGVKDASSSQNDLRKWAEDDTYNIGIATGKDGGLVVLDVDIRNGGDETLAKLEAKYGKLPPTLTVKTGGGGKHYYFKYPEEVEKIPSGAGVLGQGLDIKADGGYVVAPPSRHISGGVYEWENFNQPLAKLPTGLLDLILSKHSSHNGHKKYKDILMGSVIQEGERNNTLTSFGGYLRGKGLDEEMITEILLAINIARCQPPLPIEEVIRIAESVCRYPPGNKEEMIVFGGLGYRIDPSQIRRDWEWENWIPKGKVTMVAGETGIGKSWLACAFIAAHLGVIPYPNQAYPKDPNQSGNVLLLETEQFREEYILRLVKLGVDWQRVLFMRSTNEDIQDEDYIPNLVKDFDYIDHLIQKENITAVVVDSLSGGHHVDENSNQMGKIMNNLSTLAKKHHTPVIVVHHTRKKGMYEVDSITQDRIRGHSSIIQFTRSVIVLEKTNQPGVVRVKQIKNNLAKLQEPFGMQIMDDGIRFVQATPDTPIEKISSKLEQAKAFLKAELATTGKDRKELLEKAEKLGISRASLYRAKNELNIHSMDVKWYLPETVFTIGNNHDDKEPCHGDEKSQLSRGWELFEEWISGKNGKF